MSQKRQPEEGKGRPEGNSPEEKRRRFNLRNVVQEVIKMQSVQNVQHLLEPILEPLIRRVVKEEVELALKKHLASIKRKGGTEKDFAESRSLKLQFANGLSLPVFTGARIEGEESPLKIVLIDILKGKIVNSGPESSAKVEIVVLEGDFDGDEGENWMPDEFKSNIVREREGKKPLLTGDVFLNLNEGIGLVGEISFTDNSSWTRSRKFRLGARVVDNFDGTRVMEAKTESFIVRDHRGELYKKHHPPSLFDEVWRLEKIGKDGAFHKRLSRENIRTVKDFLTLLFIDAPRLRHILGTGMSSKMWEVTAEHARTCVVDKRIYLYCASGSERKTGADAQSSVVAAFEHWEEVVSFDDEASLLGGFLNLSDVPCTSSSPRPENSNESKLLTPHKLGGFDYAQVSAPSPDIMSSIYSSGGVSGLDDFALHGIENMGLRFDHSLGFPGQVSNPLICDTDSMAQAFCDEDHLRFFDTDIQSQNLAPLGAPADLQSAVDGFLLARAVDKAQRRWTKISSVLKWFSIRKLVAAKKTRVREIHRY
ncbi:hypothetical protein Tsubulata_041104 [Turnera subulata]|uniref:Uncharacterized protein n=1 Tax=Turnera subulata TaxID=218843 RepID=A0A9Q0JI13_9ROSI|nr:hypothetical protein Tsubulata_041104 [Turnera subulata]